MTYYDMTWHDITTHTLRCIIFHILISSCIILEKALPLFPSSLVHSLLNSHLSSLLPSNLPSQRSVSLYHLLQTLPIAVPCIIVFKSITLTQKTCLCIKVCAREASRCHSAVLLQFKETGSNCCRSNELQVCPIKQMALLSLMQAFEASQIFS